MFFYRTIIAFSILQKMLRNPGIVESNLKKEIKNVKDIHFICINGKIAYISKSFS